MRSKSRRLMIGLGLVAGLGALYQTACMAFAADQVLRTTDFCFLFDCQNGAFAGLFDFCPNSGAGDTQGEVILTGNTFIDCPQVNNN